MVIRKQELYNLLSPALVEIHVQSTGIWVSPLLGARLAHLLARLGLPPLLIWPTEQTSSCLPAGIIMFLSSGVFLLSWSAHRCFLSLSVFVCIFEQCKNGPPCSHGVFFCYKLNVSWLTQLSGFFFHLCSFLSFNFILSWVIVFSDISHM